MVFNPTTNITLHTVFTDYVQFPIYRLKYIDDDELLHLRSVQDSISRIRMIKKGQPWVDSADGLSLASLKLAALNPVTGRFRHWIGLMVLPNFIRAVQTSVQNETHRQLMIAAIALERFKLRHGFLPPNLGALSPDILVHPTYDPMTGKALEYVLKDDGGFLLYSAGKDHRDDGGETPFWFRGKSGLWEELDAVWPSESESPDSGASIP